MKTIELRTKIFKIVRIADVCRVTIDRKMYHKQKKVLF